MRERETERDRERETEREQFQLLTKGCRSFPGAVIALLQWTLDSNYSTFLIYKKKVYVCLCCSGILFVVGEKGETMAESIGTKHMLGK